MKIPLGYIFIPAYSAVFKKHLFPEVKDNWDEMKTVTDQSVETSFRLAFREGQTNQAWMAGSIAGSDPSMKSVYIPSSGSDGYTFIAPFFLHGLKEKYLFDAENGTTSFDSEECGKILRLARCFMKRENQGTSEDLRQGALIGAAVHIEEPEDLVCLRIWGRDKLRFIGYPSGDGSRHYIEGSDPITIRVNATAEEKRLAYSFLRFLLSYDAQLEAVSAESNYNYHMSVRKDVLEEQIDRMNE